jgi:hypothetical protein
MFRGSTLLPFSMLRHRKGRSIYLYRQVCGIIYQVSRSVCSSKGVFIERLPNSSQSREFSLWPRCRLLVFLIALSDRMLTLQKIVKSTTGGK